MGMVEVGLDRGETFALEAHDRARLYVRTDELSGPIRLASDCG